MLGLLICVLLLLVPRAVVLGANEAAADGDLATLVRLAQRNPPLLPTTAGADLAAGNGHLLVLQWMAARNPPILPIIMGANLAAINGHLPVLEWLARRNPPILPTIDGANLAAKKGHGNVAAWIRRQRWMAFAKRVSTVVLFLLIGAGITFSIGRSIVARTLMIVTTVSFLLYKDVI